MFPVRLFVDMPHDLPCILSCDWNFSPRAKTNINWPSCIHPCKNTRNYSWSSCSLIGHKITKVLWHQSEARTTRSVWNWSDKTVSPGAPLFVLDVFSPNFFFTRSDFPSPPLTAPGSPRMIKKRKATGNWILQLRDF